MMRQARESATQQTEVTVALLRQVVGGDAEAWTQLCSIVHPWVSSLCTKRGYGRRLQSDDTPEAIALLTIERLQRQDARALRAFLETRSKYPTTEFNRWLGVLVHNAFIDYLRSRPETQRRRDGSVRRLEYTQIAPLRPDHAAHAAEQSRDVEITRILSHLRADTFPAKGRAAILLWLAGHSTAEIAARLELRSRDDAKRLLHSSRQRLRRAVHGAPRKDSSQ